MDYSFEKVKYLYDTYGINKINDKYVIVNRKNLNTYDFESDLAQDVKFAHTWVQSTKYNQSSTSPNTGESGITLEEYTRAFNDNSRQIYNIILATTIQGLQAFGRMYKLETLENELKELVNYAHVSDIAKGLYAKPNGYASFEQWCKKASLLYNEEQLAEVLQKGISK